MNLRVRLLLGALGLLAFGLLLVGVAYLPDSRESRPGFPILAAIGPTRVRPQIGGGLRGFVILAPDGSLWGWGQNDSRKLGLNLPMFLPVPRPLRTGSDWMSIASAFSFMIALKTNGTLWAWGNINGSTGPNSTSSATGMTYGSTPVQINPDRDWRTIAAGIAHAVALKTDGTLWTWGANNRHQLGDGTMTDRFVPARPDDGSNWAMVAAGAFHTAGLRRDGTLWVWGRDPLATNRAGLTRVGTETNWTTLSAGAYHTVGCKRDASCWIWGQNAPAMMSPNRRVERDALLEVTPRHQWTTVASGNSHTLALQADGSLWSWGNNPGGQLGDGTTLPRTAPVRVGKRNDWIAIGASGDTSVALAKDGSVWTWGIRLDQPERISRLARLAGDAARRLGFNVPWGRSGPPDFTTTPWCVLQFVQPTTNHLSAGVGPVPAPGRR